MNNNLKYLFTLTAFTFLISCQEDNTSSAHNETYGVKTFDIKMPVDQGPDSSYYRNCTIHIDSANYFIIYKEDSVKLSSLNEVKIHIKKHPVKNGLYIIHYSTNIDYKRITRLVDVLESRTYTILPE